ncbi:hypothetical protein HanPSC8_Chr14g0602031 [Helianthus annuus]|nr:hypothetical protein HanPSC8_Chr14g0602031 [Helianthus annuus]
MLMLCPRVKNGSYRIDIWLMYWASLSFVEGPGQLGLCLFAVYRWQLA